MQVSSEQFAVDMMPLTDQVLSSWVSLVALIAADFKSDGKDKEVKTMVLASGEQAPGGYCHIP